MTENEAIKVINDKYETFFALSTTNVFDIAMATAIQALEEIQKYRAIGTVEQLEWCKDASHWKELFKEKLEKYEAIGTIEELKALKEKNVAKKPDFTEDKQFALCPNISCNSKGLKDKQQYCDCCGQKLDWQ